MPDTVLNRESILELLRVSDEELVSLGVRDIALFGSYARGDESGESDIDILVELADSRFDTYMDVRFFLEDLFGRSVDLVVRDAIKPRLREKILNEAIRAA